VFCRENGVSGDIFFSAIDALPSVKVRAHVFFSGRVQGVFFRAHTRDCAQSLGLTGWVRNTSDGRVEAVFEGEDAAVEDAINWCSTKQPYAEVTSKEVTMSQATGEFEMFSIMP
jgi:acylphosphatase